MTRAATVLLGLVTLLSTAAAQAPETGEGLGAPRPGVARRPARRPPSPPRPEAPPEPDEEPWGGPRVELGYTHYALVDGFGGGDVHAGFFGGYLALGRFRLGGSAELGARDYRLAQDDALIRGTLIAGYQHLPLRPFVPYAGVVGSLGALIGKRFRTPATHAFGGAGLEVGADLNLTRTLYVGLGLGWSRVSMRGVGYDLWALRLRIGL